MLCNWSSDLNYYTETGLLSWQPNTLRVCSTNTTEQTCQVAWLHEHKQIDLVTSVQTNRGKKSVIWLMSTDLMILFPSPAPAATEYTPADPAWALQKIACYCRHTRSAQNWIAYGCRAQKWRTTQRKRCGGSRCPRPWAPRQPRWMSSKEHASHTGGTESSCRAGVRARRCRGSGRGLKKRERGEGGIYPEKRSGREGWKQASLTAARWPRSTATGSGGGRRRGRSRPAISSCAWASAAGAETWGERCLTTEERRDGAWEARAKVRRATAGGRGRRNDAGEAEAKLRRATAGAKARCEALEGFGRRRGGWGT